MHQSSDQLSDPKKPSRFNDILENLIGYLETRSELLKLEFKEGLVRIIARLVSVIIIFLLVALVFVFLCVALSNYLNLRWESAYLGYAALAGIFFVLWLLMLLVKGTSWYHGIIAYFTEKMLLLPPKKNEPDN